MKRLSLLFMCLMAAFSTICADKTIELTLTIGEPHTITPYSDVGVSYNCVIESSANEYIVSDDDAFSIVQKVRAYAVQANLFACRRASRNQSAELSV